MIRNQKHFKEWLPAAFDGQMDWEFILAAWRGTQCQPMDIDCCMERMGKLIMLETKALNTPIPYGQARTLTAIWRHGITVVHVEGKGPDSIVGARVYPGEAEAKDEMVGDLPLQPANALKLCYLVHRWRCYAEGRPAPTAEQFENEVWAWDYERANNESAYQNGGRGGNPPGVDRRV